MKILISGSGIAGPTLAYWLAHYGFEPTIVETFPELRTGGYMIDFWGAGFDVAERMGLLPEIRRKGYRVREVRAVNRSGKRVAGFPVEAFNRIAQGHYISLPRGDLAASIFGRIEGRIETIFGDSIDRIEQSKEGVQVFFKRASPRSFDMVVGADGLHSHVRELVFGPESHFEKYLGFKVAAFEVDGYSPRDELAYVMYTQVGQQVARFPMRGDRTMFLFILADDKAEVPRGMRDQKALLRERFGKSGWECPQILDALDSVNDLYFDRVSQIRMDSRRGLWTQGRVSLVGDAASCISLLGGQGTSLAMVAAYILAGELHRSGGNHGVACARYQRLFGPFVLKKQNAAPRFAGAFAPRSRLGLLLRNQVFNLLRIPWFADFAVGRDFVDNIAIPAYE